MAFPVPQYSRILEFFRRSGLLPTIYWGSQEYALSVEKQDEYSCPEIEIAPGHSP
jgi:hypothetical protein